MRRRRCPNCSPATDGSRKIQNAAYQKVRLSCHDPGDDHPEDHLAAAPACVEAGLAVRDESGAQQPFPERGGILVCAPETADELYSLWRAAAPVA
jgi:hypothetical protein